MRNIIQIACLALVLSMAAGCAKEFSVTDVSPPMGQLSGGQPVTINGSGFETGMGISVYFGNFKADNVVVRSPETISVTTPSSREPQQIDVRISTDNGKEYVLKKAFTYTEKSSMNLSDLGKRKSSRESTE